MAVDTADTWSSPNRSWMAVWLLGSRQKMAPKIRALDRELEKRAMLAALSRVAWRQERPSSRLNCRHQPLRGLPLLSPAPPAFALADASRAAQKRGNAAHDHCE